MLQLHMVNGQGPSLQETRHSLPVESRQGHDDRTPTNRSAPTPARRRCSPASAACSTGTSAPRCRPPPAPTAPNRAPSSPAKSTSGRPTPASASGSPSWPARPLAADPHGDVGTVVRELRRQYDKKTRLPQSLVEELSRTAALGEQMWVEARKADDFAMFRPAAGEDARPQAAGGRGPRLHGDALRPAARRLRAARHDGRSRRRARRAARCARRRSWQQIVGSGRRPDAARPQAALPCRRAGVVRQRDLRGHRLRLQRRPARHDRAPVLRRRRRRRRAHHHALQRARFRRRVLQHPARGGPRPVRAGLAARALRPAHRRGRVAGHSRVAVADVGKPGGPQPRVLGARPAASASGVSRGAGRRDARRASTPRSTTCSRRSSASTPTR